MIKICSIIKLYSVTVSLAFPFFSNEILFFLLSVREITEFGKFTEKSNMDAIKAFNSFMNISF